MDVSKKPVKDSETRESRASAILDAAAERFCGKGFHATSIRDIAGSVGMLPGSLYYHFASKEEIFYAVYKEGVRRIGDRVRGAIDQASGPWDRLEAACIAHLEMLLTDSDYAQVIVRVVPRDVPVIENRLAELRAEYEDIFRELCDALDLPPEIDRQYFRLSLLSAMNYSQTWYHEGGDTPETIARKFFLLHREFIQDA